MGILIFIIVLILDNPEVSFFLFLACLGVRMMFNAEKRW